MMGFVQRLTTLITADAHGVVDAVEDRGLLLRQYVRDAEGELIRKRARFEAITAEEKDLAAEELRLTARADELARDVEMALGSGNEDLAKFTRPSSWGLR